MGRQHRGAVSRGETTCGRGAKLIHDAGGWEHQGERAAAVAAAVVLTALLLRRLRLGWTIVGLYLAGVAARLAYLSVTPFPVRHNDAAGHLEYIRYILDHHALPAPYAGWSFYQPPVYYLLGAGLWEILSASGITSTPEILHAIQLQSMVYQLGFVLVSILTADLWIDRLPEAVFAGRLSSRSGMRALFAALVCLWPSGVIHSVRVGNDDLLYLCFAGGFYFAVRWWLRRRDRDLTLAALCGALAVLTKSNGLLVFVLLGCLCAVRFVADGDRRIGVWLRRIGPSVLLFFLVTGVALAGAIVDTAAGKRPNLLVGNADRLDPALAVQNGATNYLWFDTTTFITQPFTSAYTDEQGRQFFWNFALKSSLFGEFGFTGTWPSNLAVMLSAALLVMLACMAIAVAWSRRDEWLEELPALLVVALLTASLAALRISIPMACSNDFRYILPALAACSYLYVRGLVRFCELGWTRLAACGRGVGWGFTGLSVLFFVVVAMRGG